MAMISISGLALMFIINIALIPVLGNQAAAYANLGAYIFICFMSYYQGQKYFPIPYPVLKMCGYLGLSVSLVFTLPLFYAYFNLRHLISDFISAVIVILFCLLIYVTEGKKLK
jgi:peptidoglycan biosynthesis protein MviN/MurJ (putative lipid II flippase)